MHPLKADIGFPTLVHGVHGYPNSSACRYRAQVPHLAFDPEKPSERVGDSANYFRSLDRLGLVSVYGRFGLTAVDMSEMSSRQDLGVKVESLTSPHR